MRRDTDAVHGGDSTARQQFDLLGRSRSPAPDFARMIADAPPACANACSFLEGVAPVQYGARIAALAIYPLHCQLLPEDRLADLFGVKFSVAAIARMSRACAKRRRGFVEKLRGLVADDQRRLCTAAALAPSTSPSGEPELELPSSREARGEERMCAAGKANLAFRLAEAVRPSVVAGLAGTGTRRARRHIRLRFDLAR